MLRILKLVFWPIYRMGLRDAAQIAQDYAYDIVGKPDDPDPLRASAYSHTAQMVAASNIAASLRKMASATILLFAIALTVSAQDYAKDRIRIAVSSNRTDIPYLQREHDYTENVNGGTAEFDVKLFKSGGLRGSLAYNARYMHYVNVYPNYFDGMNVVDLHRNVWTHSGGGQLEYIVKGAVGPFAGLFYGTRKIHEDAPRQTVRTFRLGVNIPFHKKSHFLVKGYYDFETPYGELPMGFVNPDTRTLGVGVGLRF